MYSDNTNITELAGLMEIGDVVFIHVSMLPFKKIASTTESWTNHVGIVLDRSAADPLIAESRFPLSCTTRLSRFIARSESGRIAVSRLNNAITECQHQSIAKAIHKRLGILYDTGFDFYSRRQFCSRFVHEVLEEATGTNVGEIESFSELCARNPKTDIDFWRLWFFGRIPWHRTTITPASLLRSSNMHTVYKGYLNGGIRLAVSA